MLAVMNIYDKKNLIPKVQNTTFSNILTTHLNNTFDKTSDLKMFDNLQTMPSQNTLKSQFKSVSNILKEEKFKSYSQHKQSNDISFDECDNLTLSEKETLYINRLSSEKVNLQLSQHSLNQSKEMDNPCSSPKQLSKITERLAQTKREKLLMEVQLKEPQRTTIDLASLLNFQKEKTKLEIEEIRKKNIEEELNQCTFKPQTNDTTPFMRKMSQQTQICESTIFSKKNSVPNLYHRSHMLHSLAKPQSIKRDKNTHDIEYERDCDQCTFQPETNVRRLNSPTAKQNTLIQSKSIQSIQKNVERLHSARIKNMVKEQLGKQGTTVSKKKLQQVQENVRKSIKQPLLSHQIQHNQENNQVELDLNTQSFTNLFQQKQKSMPSLLQNLQKKDQETSIQICSPQIDSANEFVSSDSLQNAMCQNSSIKIIEEERVPQLFVDVNIEEGKSARIIVYEGDRSEDLSIEFARQFDLLTYSSFYKDLDESMRLKLKDLLDLQINSLLHKIEEVSANEDDEEDDELDQFMYNRSTSKPKSRIK